MKMSLFITAFNAMFSARWGLAYFKFTVFLILNYFKCTECIRTVFSLTPTSRDLKLMPSQPKIFISYIAVILSRKISCKINSHLRLYLDKTMSVFVYHLSLLHHMKSSSVMWVVSAAQCWVAAKLRLEPGRSELLVVYFKWKSPICNSLTFT